MKKKVRLQPQADLFAVFVLFTVNAFAVTVDCDDKGEILNFKAVDRFAQQVGKGDAFA